MKYWCYYTDVVRYLEKVEALCAQKIQAAAYLVWQDDDGPSMIAGPGVEWFRGDGPPPDIASISLRADPPAVTARRAPLPRNKKNRAAAQRPQHTPRTQCRHGATKTKHPRQHPRRAAGFRQKEAPERERSRPAIGSGAGDCAPAPSHTTGHSPRWAHWRRPAACRVEPAARHNPDPAGAAGSRLSQERRTKGVRIFQNPLKPAHPAPRNSRGVDGSPRLPRASARGKHRDATRRASRGGADMRTRAATVACLGLREDADRSWSGR